MENSSDSNFVSEKEVEAQISVKSINSGNNKDKKTENEGCHSAVAINEGKGKIKPRQYGTAEEFKRKIVPKEHTPSKSEDKVETEENELPSTTLKLSNETFVTAAANLDTDSLNVEINNEEIITPKRKRGRPPKSQTHTPEQTSTSSTTQKALSKKGRKVNKGDYSKLNDSELDETQNELSLNSLNKEENEHPSKILKLSNETCAIAAANLDTDSPKVEVNNEEIITPKRKRGRPPKSQTHTPEQTFTPPTTQKALSKRGRKVNKVDYSTLNDSELDDTQPTKPKKNWQLKLTSMLKHKETNQNGSPSSEFSHDSIKCDVPDEEMKFVPPAPKPNRGRKKKIKETSTCMSDIESDACKLKSCKSEEDPEAPQTSGLGMQAKIRDNLFKALEGKEIGYFHENTPTVKVKKGPCIHNTDGSYTCMICNKPILVEDWIYHNARQHYNLSWRHGESPVERADEVTVKKILTKLLKTEGKLTCNKCNKESINVAEFYKHLEDCDGVLNASGKVTCAVCHLEMEKTHWTHHKYRKHNNLAWREGDPPLDLQNKELIMLVLGALYKKRKPLHCETCDAQKKSVLGYLSHKTICSKSMGELDSIKVVCNFCQKKLLPVSMDVHLRGFCKYNQSEVTPDNPEHLDNSYIESGTGQRRAAKQ